MLLGSDVVSAAIPATLVVDPASLNVRGSCVIREIPARLPVVIEGSITMFVTMGEIVATTSGLVEFTAPTALYVFESVPELLSENDKPVTVTLSVGGIGFVDCKEVRKNPLLTASPPEVVEKLLKTGATPAPIPETPPLAWPEFNGCEAKLRALMFPPETEAVRFGVASGFVAHHS